MGTIRIEEYASVGGPGAIDSSPVANLDTCLKTTVDATTSTSAESITLNDKTRFIVVTAEEIHRVSTKSSDVSDQYAVIPASSTISYAVKGGEALYYKADA